MKYFLLTCAIIFPLLSTGAYAHESNQTTSVFAHPLTQKNEQALMVVRKTLSKEQSLQGKFVQTRDIALLSKPLTSKGTFTLSKEKGLVWKQAEPFPSTLKVTDNKIEQQMGDSPPMVMTREKQPIVFSFTHIFLSIFKGDTSQVKQYFDIFFTGNAAKWKIGLKPKGSPLNKAIKQITLSGGNVVQEVEIQEAKKNMIVIQFSDVKPLINQK